MGFRSALVQKIRPYSLQDSESKKIGILFWKIAVPDPDPFKSLGSGSESFLVNVNYSGSYS
jgi:hypothetical protein